MLVAQRVAQNAVLNVSLDVGESRFGIGQAMLNGFAMQKLHQFVVISDCLKNCVVSQCQKAGLLASIVPDRDIAVGTQMSLVDDGLSAEIKLWVKVGNAVKQNRCLAGVNFIASDERGGSQVFDSAKHQLLPLPVNQVSADETPAVFTLHITFAIVHTKFVQRVVGVGMLGVKQQTSVGTLGVKDAMLV